MAVILWNEGWKMQAPHCQSCAILIVAQFPRVIAGKYILSESWAGSDDEMIIQFQLEIPRKVRKEGGN